MSEEPPKPYLSHILQNRKDAPFAFRHLRGAIERERKKLISALQKKQIYFVDIPRTSSTSINEILGQTFGYPYGKRNWSERQIGDYDNMALQKTSLINDHFPARFARDLVTPAIWNSLNSFTVVRNPYDWIVSYYNLMSASKTFNLSFDAFLEECEKRLAAPFSQRDQQPRSYQQSDLITDEAGTILVKKMFRFEDREEIDFFLLSLGVPEKFLKMRFSKFPNKVPKIDNYMKQKIHKIYAQDFDLLGY